jgi:hypothetical protein
MPQQFQLTFESLQSTLEDESESLQLAYSIQGAQTDKITRDLENNVGNIEQSDTSGNLMI